jgi:CheY-like chemotaxis protein
MKKTVLVIEDDPDMRELIGLVLANSGYRLISAVDGVEAVETCLRDRPDLLLMDLNMPRMNGIDAIRTLRQKGYDRPIVVLTASESEQARQDAKCAGCDDFIVKSLDMRDVERIINRHLSEAGGV